MNMSRWQIPGENRLGAVLRCALSGGTPRRAATLAAVVGSILVIINQWDACFGQVPFDWAKVGLNYLVPYLVSTYTSISKDLQAANRGAVAVKTASVNPPAGNLRSPGADEGARRNRSC